MNHEILKFNLKKIKKKRCREYKKINSSIFGDVEILDLVEKCIVRKKKLIYE